MRKKRILIVADDLIIVKAIKLDLLEGGFQVVDSVNTYETAIKVVAANDVDLVLIDINLSSKKLGLDVAQFIKSNFSKLPFIFITAELDIQGMNKALELNPHGYIVKPFKKFTLWANIEIAIKESRALRPFHSSGELLSIVAGKSTFMIRENEIMYAKVEHVYSHLFLQDKKPIILRKSLTNIFNQLESSVFFQPHQGYIINENFVTRWDNLNIWINTVKIPISRGRKSEVIERLKHLTKNSI